MSLPGLALPGLALSTPTPLPMGNAPPSSSSLPGGPTALLPTRTEDLPPRSELRFEVPPGKNYSIRLARGHAELFGTELAPAQTHTFTGTKGAVFTWHGCALEIQGEAESEYVGSETEGMVEWMNVHGMLETLRDDAVAAGAAAAAAGGGGPRVLVVGPDHCGKSSLVKSLTAWAIRAGRNPTVVNLDPREGVLSIPSSLTAVTMSSLMDVEDSAGGGWGTSPISGPTNVPVKTPLVYHFPFASPGDCPDVFKAIATRAALAVTSRLEEDRDAKDSGLIIDSPGSLNQPKDNYSLVAHIVSEFSITVLLTLGSERLYSDMVRKFANSGASDPEDTVHVFRISTTGGAVARDEGFMRQMRQQQIKTYFFGDAKAPLNPHGQWWDFADLSIYKAIGTSSSSAAAASSSADVNQSFLPGMDEDEALEAATAANASNTFTSPQSSSSSSSSMLEKIHTPSQNMLNGILAIKFCPGNAGPESIRDSCVMGFVYVAEVDETRKRVRFLAPHPSRWGDRALVWGEGWPESVGDLVA